MYEKFLHSPFAINACITVCNGISSLELVISSVCTKYIIIDMMCEIIDFEKHSSVWK